MPRFITLHDETTGKLCYVAVSQVVALRQYINADGGSYTVIDTTAQDPDALLVSETPTEILASMWHVCQTQNEGMVPV